MNRAHSGCRRQARCRAVPAMGRPACRADAPQRIGQSDVPARRRLVHTHSERRRVRAGNRQGTWLAAGPRRPPALADPAAGAMGHPSEEFPRPWSIYRWIEGEPASTVRIADPARFAADLAAFLFARYAIDASAGPPPGVHSAFRGGPLAVWDEQTRQSIRLLADDIDAEARYQGMGHGPGQYEGAGGRVGARRFTASNLLIADGALHAVIDFGCAAVGDTACDLVMAWTFLRRGQRHGIPPRPAPRPCDLGSRPWLGTLESAHHYR
jgi:hypothetical protein